MKIFKTSIVIIFLITSFLSSQNKDFRAELDILGGITELSISPDNSIWFVTSLGNTYYSKDIYSTWHDGSLFFCKDFDERYFTPNFDRITFFNRDTAILTGYISFDEEKREKGGIYRTEDGGKHWKCIKYGGDGSIYFTFTDKMGNAWIGGSAGELSYSSNFGRDWKKLGRPVGPSQRIHCIFMKNHNEGVAGADPNKILYTTDNWKTYIKLKTPFDQRLYENYYLLDENNIEKIFYWKGYIVVSQGGHAFYTNENNIKWESFPLNIQDFDIDNKTGDIWAVTRDLQVVRFNTPSKYTVINSIPFNKIPLSIKAINGSFYAYSRIENRIYKINDNEYYSTYLFTADHKIKRPELIKKNGSTLWGVNGQHLYVSNAKIGRWYREYIFPTSIEDIRLFDAKTAVLWDGNKNYKYTLGSKVLEIYNPEKPFTEFLKYPIKKMFIGGTSVGCFHGVTDEIIYISVSDSVIKLNKSLKYNGAKTEEISNIPERLKKKINISELYEILNTINAAPSRIPLLAEFQITKGDKVKYKELCEHKVKGSGEIMMNVRYDSLFYENIAQQIDTLSSNSIDKILNEREGFRSTTSQIIEIRIINSNKDTLVFSRMFYENSNGWHLPWTVKYNGIKFHCYNINFSKYIRSLMPDNFLTSEYFQNSYFMLNAANYFYYNKLKSRPLFLHESGIGIIPEWVSIRSIIVALSILLVLLVLGMYIYKKIKITINKT